MRAAPWCVVAAALVLSAPGCDGDEIRQAFKRRAKELHPDHSRSERADAAFRDLAKEAKAAGLGDEDMIAITKMQFSWKSSNCVINLTNRLRN